jgi:transposase
MERDFLEEQLAAGRSLEQIGRLAGRHPSTVGYWVKQYGLTAVFRDKHAAKGGLSRAVLEAHVARGASLRTIARAHDVSETTVKHWMRKFGLQTARSARLKASQAAHRTEKEVVAMDCARHGLTSFVLEGRGSFRCLRCRAEWVAARRRRVKEILVRESGGCCALCGYDRYVGALEFHHVDPAQKSFALARGGITRSLDRVRAEAAKCVLVCANCHAEIEAGVATLPGRSESGRDGCVSRPA